MSQNTSPASHNYLGRKRKEEEKGKERRLTTCRAHKNLKLWFGEINRRGDEFECYQEETWERLNKSSRWWVAKKFKSKGNLLFVCSSSGMSPPSSGQNVVRFPLSTLIRIRITNTFLENKQAYIKTFCALVPLSFILPLTLKSPESATGLFLFSSIFFSFLIPSVWFLLFQTTPQCLFFRNTARYLGLCRLPNACAGILQIAATLCEETTNYL